MSVKHLILLAFLAILPGCYKRVNLPTKSTPATTRMFVDFKIERSLAESISAQLQEAIDVYRERFRPSERLADPHVMLGVNVIAADTDAEARLHATSLAQAFLRLRKGQPSAFPPPVRDFEASLSEPERALLQSVLACSFVGTPDAVASDLRAFARGTGADELMVVCNVFDFAARLRSYELLATAFGAG